MGIFDTCGAFKRQHAAGMYACESNTELELECSDGIVIFDILFFFRFQRGVSGKTISSPHIRLISASF